jgi:hypothetical protein
MLTTTSRQTSGCASRWRGSKHGGRRHAVDLVPDTLHQIGSHVNSPVHRKARSTRKATTSRPPDASLRVAIRLMAAQQPAGLGYVATVFRIHRGKAVAAIGQEGY